MEKYFMRSPTHAVGTLVPPEFMEKYVMRYRAHAVGTECLVSVGC